LAIPNDVKNRVCIRVPLRLHVVWLEYWPDRPHAVNQSPGSGRGRGEMDPDKDLVGERKARMKTNEALPLLLNN
jgi:hypothetical protein